MSISIEVRKHQWASIGDSLLAHRASDLALRLGHDVHREIQAMLPNEASPFNLYGKLSSAALAFEWLDLCFPSQGWELPARGCLETATHLFQNAETQPVRPGLFEGVTGFASAVQTLSRGGSRYSNLHAQLHELVIRLGSQYLDTVRCRTLPFPSDYDLISGATGLGCYAVTALQYHGSLALIERCLEFLTSSQQGGAAPSRFHVPAARIESPSMRAHYPNGYIDCGMAHGLGGPISLLALSLEAGIQPGIYRPVLEELAGWLSAQGRLTDYGINWPIAVDERGSCENARAAWCYGNPGVSRALWLAGRALNREDLCNRALEALLTVSRMPRYLWQVETPTFCHGLAGLTQIALRFAQETGIAEVNNFAARLTEEILETYTPEPKPGDSAVPRSTLMVEGGLLEGTSAIILTLLAAGSSNQPAWDRTFLLS